MRKDIFDNKTEKTFAECNAEFSMNLTDKERAMLILDKNICWSRSAFDDVIQWNECKTELKCYHIKYYVQKKLMRGAMNVKLTTMKRFQNTPKLMKMMIQTKKHMLMVD